MFTAFSFRSVRFNTKNIICFQGLHFGEALFLWVLTWCSLGFDGCSSHSGSRTAITKWSRNITAAGGSLRDVQQLARHSSLQMTQKYIEVSEGAMKRGGRLMKRLLTTLVILTGLIGSAGAVWADEYADVKKTFDSGDHSLALKTA